MEDEQLQEEIKRIVKIASGVPDKFQEKCFEILLNNLLPGQAAPTSGSVLGRFSPTPTTEVQYQNVIAFDGDDIKILKNISSKKKAEKAVSLALMYLFAKSLKKIEEVPVSEIREVCKSHAAFDSANFSTHLKGAKQHIILKGSGKSRIAKLTVPGVEEAKSIIAELNKK